MNEPKITALALEEILARLRTLQEVTKKDEQGKRPEAPIIPLIDPTANVLSLVAKEVTRLNDLRDADNRHADTVRKIEEECGVRTNELREKLAAAESRRIDALNMAEARRLDAVLAEQKSAVALASEKTAAQAATLAAQVLSSAEALRAQLAATVASLTASIQQLRDSVEKRLQTVEQNQFAAGGASTQRIEGRQTNQWTIGTVLFGAIGVVGMIVGIITVVIRLGK